MKAEPCAALIAARREERIESAPSDVQAHSAPVVGKDDLDVVRSCRPHLDVDRSGPAVWKSVRDRIEKKVGEHLTVWAGIGIHGQVRLALDVERETLSSQAGPQAHDHLLGKIAEVEGPLIGIVTIGSNLLEGGDQFCGAVEIGNELGGSVAAGFEEIREAGAPEIAARDFGCERRGLALQRGSNSQTDADR